MNLHLRRGKLVEKVGRAPLINEFTRAIDPVTIAIAQKPGMRWVVPVQSASDFSVCSNRVPPEGQSIFLNRSVQRFDRDRWRERSRNCGVHAFGGYNRGRRAIYSRARALIRGAASDPLRPAARPLCRHVPVNRWRRHGDRDWRRHNAQSRLDGISCRDRRVPGEPEYSNDASGDYRAHRYAGKPSIVQTKPRFGLLKRPRLGKTVPRSDADTPNHVASVAAY